jgi:hypothetical protein
MTGPRNSHHAAPAHEPPAVMRAAGLVVALTAGLAILFIAFGLPAAKSGPHDVPIGISGPQAANGQFAGMLEQNAPGAFDVTYYPGEDALRTAIRDRDVYGGIAVTPDGPTLMLASGGSPMVAQILTQVGSSIAQHTGMPLHTVDLAPLSHDDPRGTGLAASALPLALAGLLPAVVLVAVFPSRLWLRFGATVVFAGLAAVTIAAVLCYVFGSIETNFWGVAAGLMLGVLATALTMLGLGSLFGRVGLDERAGNAAEGLGHLRAVVAAGRHRHAAALDGILRRRRSHRGDSAADLLVAHRNDAGHRRRAAATRGGIAARGPIAATRDGGARGCADAGNRRRVGCTRLLPG